jgi:hypothetical protein
MVTIDNDADTPDPAKERAARRLRVLEELAEIGLAIARGLREQAAVELARARQAQESWTPPGAGPAPAPRGGRDIAMAYARVAKAVRLTLWLEERLTDPARGPAASPEAENSGAEPAGAGQRARRKLSDAAVKDMCRERVERAIDAEATGEAAERLRCDLHERLDDIDEMAELAGLPLDEIIARLCQDLGLTPDASLAAETEAELPKRREGAAGAARAGGCEADEGPGAARTTAWPHPPPRGP